MPTFAGKNQMRHGTHFTGLLREASRKVSAGARTAYHRSMAVPKILLYYVMAPVPDPRSVMLWQRELCERLGLRGRIIVSPHGINRTVGGEIEACKQYIKRTQEYPPFKSLSETVK